MIYDFSFIFLIDLLSLGVQPDYLKLKDICGRKMLIIELDIFSSFYHRILLIEAFDLNLSITNIIII